MAYFSPNTLFVFTMLTQQGLALTFTSQFQHWYPQYAMVWKETLRQNCSTQYAEYLTGDRNPSKIDWISGGGYFSILTQPVVQCLLDSLSEYNKTAVTCAQVLLGIMPTVLSLLSARYEELAMLVIVSHRPVLATLLALGSPSVFLSRAFDYYSPAAILRRKQGRLRPLQPRGRGRWIISLMEYVVAMAAVANVAHVCYQLGLQSFTALWGDSVLMPMMWAVLVLPIHIFGVISMRLRIRREGTGYTSVNGGRSTRKAKGRMGWFRSTPRPFKRLWQTEITPSVAQVSPSSRNPGLILACHGGYQLGLSAISFLGRS